MTTYDESEQEPTPEQEPTEQEPASEPAAPETAAVEPEPAPNVGGAVRAPAGSEPVLATDVDLSALIERVDQLEVRISSLEAQPSGRRK